MGRIIKDHQTLNAFTLSGAMNSELPGYFYMKIGLTLSSNYKQVKIGSSSFGICLYVFWLSVTHDFVLLSVDCLNTTHHFFVDNL